MKAGEYRINEFSLLRITNDNTIKSFYVLLDAYPVKQYYTSLDSTVWGLGEVKGRLNKFYSADYLIQPSTLPISVPSTKATLFIAPTTDIDISDMFGIHLIAKDSIDGSVLYSQIVSIEDIGISTDNLLIDGKFWYNKIDFYLPVADTCYFQATIVSYSDLISEGIDIGTMINFPKEFVPLITDMPNAEYITVTAAFADSMYLTVGLITSENKTIDKSIRDYFGVDTDDSIDITYQIRYGLPSAYKTILVSDPDNKYNSITLALPLPVGLNDIIISANIYVGGKYMKRDVVLHTDLQPIYQHITDSIIHPETIIPVTVVNETVINQTVIDSKETVKLIPTYQPVFAQIITTDIVFAKKNITFNVAKTIKGILSLYTESGEFIDSVLGTALSDDVVVYNLGVVTQPTEDCKYVLYDSGQNVIGLGSCKLK